MAAYFDPNDPQALIREINVLYRKLGITPPNLDAFLGDVDELRNELESVKDIWMDVNNGIGDVSKGFKAILDEVKDKNFTLNESKRSLTSLNSLTSQLRDQQLGINNLSAKELILMKQKADKNVATLKANREALEAKEVELTNQSTLTAKERKELAEILKVRENINGLLNDGESSLIILNGLLNDEIAETKKIEKQLGAVGGVLKGLGNIPILNNLIDFQEATLVAEKSLRAQETTTKAMVATFKNLGGQLMESITSPATLIVGTISELVIALKATDDGAGDMAKKMNLTYTEALRVRGELGTMAALSGDVALTTKGLQESYMAVGQALGSNAMLNQQDLITMTKLTKQAGFTHDELMGIEKLSLVNGKTLEQNSQEILGGAKAYASRNKLVLNEKQILREVNSASAALKLSLGGSAEQVAIAASKAKQFGINLEQAEKIAQSLLNFESSIEAELSAELLTGKNLNLEKARLLALNGDIAEASAEIAKQVGTSADFAKMNVIQQDALAKAAGMTRDELAQSLMDREALAKLSAVEGATAQEKFNNLVKQVGLEEAKKRLGEEGLANQFAQQSVQERFTQSVEKLKEIFVQLAEPILQIVSPFADLVSNILPAINFLLSPLIEGFSLVGNLVGKFINGLKEGQPIIVGLTAAMVALKAETILTAIFGIFSSLAKIPFGVGLLLAGTAVAGMISLATKSKTQVKDFSYSNKTGETTISTKEGGLYSISPNDEIAVAPKINQVISSKPDTPTKINTYNNTSTATPTITQDNSALIAELKSLRNELSNKPFKSPDVYLDGEKISSNTNGYQRKGWIIN